MQRFDMIGIISFSGRFSILCGTKYREQPMINLYKYLWLRRQLIASTIVYTIIFLSSFIWFYLNNQPLRNSENYIGYLLGLFIISFLGSYVFPNPIRVSPLFGRKHLVMNEDEAESFLIGYWRKLPRFYFTLFCLLFGMLTLTVLLIPGKESPRNPFGTFFMGMIVGYFLCLCVSSIYMLWQLQRIEE